MNRDRIVQLVALVILLGCVAGTTLLSPRIQQQRSDLGLRFELDSDQQVKPAYVLTAAALGSFRGLVVDALWYRLEQLRRQGRVYESNTLAEWITTLQPRFPSVWQFHAWNLAYNISVMTHTPSERWMWVEKSIRLLRNEGIPHNPRAIKLYRELGRTYFYKIGGHTDDMHWTYKRRVVHEWEQLLGRPPYGASTEQAIAEFKQISDAADRYFDLDDRPSHATLDAIESLIDANPDVADALERLQNKNLRDFIATVPTVQQTLRNQRRRTVADELTPLLQNARARMQRWQNGNREPLQVLQNDVRETRAVIERWRELGLGLNEDGLREFGEMLMYADRVHVPSVLNNPSDNLSDKFLAMMRFYHEQMGRRTHEGRVYARRSVGLRRLLAFLRAKVLLQNYHMKPHFMYTLMQRYGPLDWRHWHSHGFYWSVRGVEMAGGIHEDIKYDVLNTYRQAIHSLQEMLFNGRLEYDPFAPPGEQIGLLPDPRFITPYENMLTQARDVSDNITWMGQGNQRSFDTGHENFLHKAIVFSYFYGHEQQAQDLYDRVRRLYGDDPGKEYKERYKLPLSDFARRIWLRDQGMRQMSRAAIEGALLHALVRGLARGDAEVFRKFRESAKLLHQQYNREKRMETVNAERDKAGLLSFEEFEANAYVSFMRSQRISIYQRSRVYRNTPLALRRRVFSEIQPTVYQQARAQGYNPEMAFPPPPGAEQAGPAQPQQPEEGGGTGTVERK